MDKVFCLNLYKATTMAASATEKELLQYVAQMDEQQKKSLLEMIKVFVKPVDGFTGAITFAQYNQELDEAEAEFDRGDYITHSEMLQQIKGW